MNTVSSKVLDHLAISMAVICGIHCLVTPVLLVALPIIATTFWVDENFHLWMLLLVIPTTSLAIWSGCRRHKDRWVMAAAALGLGILVTALITERMVHAQNHSQSVEASLHASSTPNAGIDSRAHVAGDGCCALHPAQAVSSDNGETTAKTSTASLSGHALLNTLGGLFLVLGHTRNFMLCRKQKCFHEEAFG